MSTQVTDLVTKPLDKRSHNFIFYMLKRYYYLVNPSCAMAAQGMKIGACVRVYVRAFSLVPSVPRGSVRTDLN